MSTTFSSLLSSYLVVKTWAQWHYDIKILSPKVVKARGRVYFMSYCPSVHVLTSIASIANALYIIKLLYDSTFSMVTVAIVL